MIKQYFDWSEGKPTNLNKETIEKFKELDEMLKETRKKNPYVRQFIKGEM